MRFLVHESAVAFAAVIWAIACALLAYMTWKLYQARRIPWRLLDCRYPGAMYYAPASVDEHLISKSLTKAAEALAAHTKWTNNEIYAAFCQLRILVMSEDSWTDLYGRKIAGFQQHHVVVVNKSLASLCHECAHFLEYVIDKEIDDAHQSWSEGGIWRADEVYRQWLATYARG